MNVQTPEGKQLYYAESLVTNNDEYFVDVVFTQIGDGLIACLIDTPTEYKPTTDLFDDGEEAEGETWIFSTSNIREIRNVSKMHPEWMRRNGFEFKEAEDDIEADYRSIMHECRRVMKVFRHLFEHYDSWDGVENALSEMGKRYGENFKEDLEECFHYFKKALRWASLE